jgi:ribonuclease E
VAPPQEQGFFGWVKSLFGGSGAPAAAPAPAVTPAPAATPDTTGRGEPRRDGRNSEGRGRRNGRDANRDGAARDGQRDAGREGAPSEGRGRRGERSAEARAPRDGERRPEGNEAREPREPREGRNGREGSRGRRDAEPRSQAASPNGEVATQGQVQVPGSNGATADASAPQQPRSERGPRRERGERGRGERNERGDRALRSAEGQEAGAPASAATPPDFVDTAPLASLPDLDLSSHEVTTGHAASDDQRPGRRSRDRYGRDRRDRAPRDAAGAAASAMMDFDPSVTARADSGEEPAPQEAPRRSYFDTPATAPEHATHAAPAQAQPAAQVTAAEHAPAAALAPAAAVAKAEHRGMPKVQGFELPVEALHQVATSSGLEWVNSDAAKVAAVQAAIAAEPRPVRVPRERPPAIVIDEGPLVLVETRRDLSAMTLPFEQPPAA